MALDPLDIEARVRGADGELRTVSGQWQVATAEGCVEDVRLIPERPRVPQDVVEALGRADWIIVGPGSWYTSVLPHLMIPEIAEAIRTSPARICITTNLSVGAGGGGHDQSGHARGAGERLPGVPLRRAVGGSDHARRCAGAR